MLLHSRRIKCAINFYFMPFMVISIAFALVGCVKPRVFPRYLTVSDVINNIECELSSAILQNPGYGEWLYEYAALVDLSLEVFREGGVTGDASYVVPHLGGIATLNLTAGLTKSSKARISFDFLAGPNLGAFIGATDATGKRNSRALTSPVHCDFDREKRRGRYVAGETGLKIWLDEFVRGVDATGIEIHNKTEGFTYAVDFIVTANGNIIPRLDRFRSNDHRIFGNVNASRTRKDTHTLKVVFTKVLPAQDKDTELMALVRIEKLLREQIGKGHSLSGDPKGTAVPKGPPPPSPGASTREQLNNRLQRELLRDLVR